MVKLTEEGVFGILDIIQSLDLVNGYIGGDEYLNYDLDLGDSDESIEVKEGKIEDHVRDTRKKLAFTLLDLYEPEDFLISNEDSYINITEGLILDVKVKEFEKIMKHLQVLSIVCGLDLDEDDKNDRKTALRKEKQTLLDELEAKLYLYILDHYPQNDYVIPKQYIIKKEDILQQ